jgi:hypothetical protein
MQTIALFFCFSRKSKKKLLMKKIYTCLFVLMLTGCLGTVLAQNTVLRSFKVSKVYSRDTYDGVGSDEEYRWKFWLDGNPHYGEECIKKNVSGSGWYSVNVPFGPDRPLNFESGPNRVAVRSESWEEDGGSNCSYDGSWVNHDDGHCDEWWYLEIDNYAPGVTNTREFKYCDGSWGARYTFSYDVPNPKNPSVSSPAGNLCDANPIVVLSSKSFLKSPFVSNTVFEWEYYTPQTGWNFLKSSSAASLSTAVTGLRELPGLKNITTTTEVRFRVRSKYQNSYYSAFSGPSSSIFVSPLAPAINSVTVSACNPDSLAKMVVNLTTNQSSVYYVLRNGYNPSPCNPETGNCGGIRSGKIVGNTFEIQSIPVGDYTLLVSNSGGANGVCYNYIYKEVQCSTVVADNTEEILPDIEDDNATQGMEALQSVDGIKSISSTPNPNNGEFEVTVELNREQRLSLVVYDAQGVIHHTSKWNRTQRVASKISLLKSGVYMVKAITEGGSKWIRVRVSR